MKKRGPASAVQGYKELDQRIRNIEAILRQLAPETKVLLDSAASLQPSVLMSATGNGTVPAAIAASSSAPLIKSASSVTLGTAAALETPAKVRSPKQTKIEFYVRDTALNAVTFVGPTATACCPLVYTSPRYQDGFLNVPMAINKQLLFEIPVDIKGPPCNVELLGQLVSLYFLLIHPRVPMVDKESFTTQLLDCQNHTVYFTFLLNAIVATVVQALSGFESLAMTDAIPVYMSCSQRIKALFPHIMDRPHLYSVQAMLLLTICGLTRTEDFDSWLYLGMAVRMAQELGMHKCAEFPRNPSLHAIMKRTWQCCYIMDRTGCLLVGRPHIIREEDCDKALFELSVDQINSEEKSYDEDLFYMVKLSMALTHLSSIGTISDDPELTAKAASKCKSLLQEWILNVPSSIQAVVQGDISGTSEWSAAHDMACVYHNARVLLSRMSLGICDDKAMNSALCCAKVLRHIPSPSTKNVTYVNPHVPHCILGPCSYFMEQVIQTNEPAALSNLRHCLVAYDRLTANSYKAARYRAHVTEILGAKGIDVSIIFGPNDKESSSIVEMDQRVSQLVNGPHGSNGQYGNSNVRQQSHTQPQQPQQSRYTQNPYPLYCPYESQEYFNNEMQQQQPGEGRMQQPNVVLDPFVSDVLSPSFYAASSK